MRTTVATTSSPHVGRLVATPIFGYAGIVEVSAGATHTCALQSTGVVSCWGSNAEGELGDGTTTPRPTPAPIVDP